MRPFLCLVTLAALLCFAGEAPAAETGAATVPMTNSRVVTGGGAAYVPTPARPPRKPARKRRRAVRTPAKRQPVQPVPVAGRHHFPVAGAFSWGGPDARFGTPRSGHTHQGQDLVAPEGTPVVAPTAGVVQTVQYQASGAGHYVVLDGDGEDRDYVFMHLRSGSIPVKVGQRVAGGTRLGEVGNTGRSFGAHLHFEIWDGAGWYSGGEPVDPYPLLRLWAPS